MQNTFDTWQKEPQRINPSIHELLVYYLYMNEDYPRFFLVVNKTKNLEQ